MEDKLTPIEAEVTELPGRSEPLPASDSYGTAAMPKPKRSYAWLWIPFGILIIVLCTLAVLTSLFDVRLERKNGSWSLQMRNSQKSDSEGIVRDLPLATGVEPDPTAETLSQGPLSLQVEGDKAPTAASSASEVYDAVSAGVVCLEYRTVYGTVSTTGVVLSPDGYLLTAALDPGNAIEIRAVFSDGTTAAARRVRTDQETGLVLLKADAEDLKPVVFAPDGAGTVGQTVYCVANPYGSFMNNVFCEGMLSAVRTRELDGTSFRLMLSSCALQAEGYGIPLFDGAGRLLGLTAPAARRMLSVSPDPCFALSSEDVRRVVKNLWSGTADSDLLGLRVELIPTATRIYFGYPGTLWITEISADSPLSGVFSSYDVITHVNGKQVWTVEEYEQALREAAGSTSVRLTVYRYGRSYEATIQLNPT